MSRIPHPRRLRRKAIVGLAGVAFLASGTLAVAQIGGQPDGSPGGAQQPNLTTQRCGPLSENIIKTQNAPSVTNAVNFQQLPGAVTQVTIPPGAGRCVKVLFTAETACGLSGAADFCSIRALDGALPLDPNGGGFQAMDSEDGSAAAHAYEWVGHLDPGVHNIRIERRVANNATNFWTDDWTFDVEVHL